MSSQFSLLRHSSVYLVGSIVTAGFSFISIPLLTNNLTTDEFGLLEFLNRMASIATLIIFAGLRQAFIRTLLEEKSVEWRGRVVGTTLSIIVTFGVLLIALLTLLHPFFEYLQWLDQVDLLLYCAVVIWLPLEVFFTIGTAYFECRGESLIAITINALRGAGYLLLLVYFLIYRDESIAYVFIANTIVCIGAGAYFVSRFRQQYRLQFDTRILKEMLTYSLPYLPTAFFAYWLINADRLFIVAYHDLVMVGIYSLAFKLGVFGFSVAMEPLNRIWAPFAFNAHHAEQGAQDIGAVFMIFAVASLFTALGLSLFSELLVSLVAPSEYTPAAKMLPIIACAAAIHNIANRSDIGLLIARKTHYKPLVFCIAALVCVGMNAMLVPTYGALGAAWSYLGGVIALLIANIQISNRFYRIQFSYSYFLLACGAILAPYIVRELCIETFNFGLVAATAIALGTALVVAIVFWQQMQIWQTMKRIRL